jgi:hypothetical protein
MFQGHLAVNQRVSGSSPEGGVKNQTVCVYNLVGLFICNRRNQRAMENIRIQLVKKGSNVKSKA